MKGAQLVGKAEESLTDLGVLSRSFQRTLLAENKAPRTVQTYGEAAGWELTPSAHATSGGSGRACRGANKSK